jgi:hypothetical protein
MLTRRFTISARGKSASTPIQMFIKEHFSDIPLEQIDSFFGFTTEPSTLYGGRVYGGTEISRYDLRSMYSMNINLRLPMTNHEVSAQEYKENLPLFEKYHRPGNAVIITNNQLAKWLRKDFPDYRLEASVIKNINSLKKIEAVEEIYNAIILPMSSNLDEDFLCSIEDKDQITLFANAGCALTCPAKMCYPSISKINKNIEGAEIQCSRNLKQRDMLGMQDFDLDHLESLGFHSFKLLRSRRGGMTGV